MKKTITILAVLTLSLNVFAQKCNYGIDKIDDFTKKMTVRTKPLLLFENKAGAFLNNILLDNGATQIKFYVCADYNGGMRSLQFILEEGQNGNHTEDYSQLDFLFTNDQVISLKDDNGNGDKYSDATWLYWRFYTPTEEQWKNLGSYTLKKIRVHYNDNTTHDVEIKEKFINNIANSIKCLEDKGLPKGQNTAVSAASSDNTIGFTPTNDTTSISIYKQWIKIYTFKDGMPKSTPKNHFLTFNKDNSYVESALKNNGDRNVYNGTIKVITPNKFIELKLTDKPPYTWEILRLTKTEMEVQSENGFHAIYTVF